MMKKLFRNKKAVSPVIATVLMILVTMVGMTLLFAFVSSYTENYKAGVGSSVMESISVEDVWFSPQGNYNDLTPSVQIYVYNVGKVDSTITSIFANGLKLTDDSARTNFNLDLKVPIGEHKSITLYWNQPWVKGNQYTFTISTKTGSSFDVMFSVP